MKFVLLLLGVFATSGISANTIHKRVELMKYTIQAESAVRHDTEINLSWWKKLKLIDEAHAYREGESCLVLGFKSQFKNGMCRMANAEGIQDYKKECASGTLPCNPQVFGKPSDTKPFCISTKSGKELSKACAKETFSHLAQKSKSPLLSNMKSFDLEKLNLSKVDTALENAFKEIFSHGDTDLNSAISFTRRLCEDLKASTQTGHQPLDLKTCEGHLALLEKGAKPSEQSASKNPVVDSEATPSEDICVEPVLEKKVSENIHDAQVATSQTEAQAWIACINKIEAHKIVAKQLAGIAEHDKERDRYFGYWHQIGKEKNFGRLCESSTTESNAVFTFLGPQGFSWVNVPASNIKNNINRVSANGKEYYLIRDMLGDYFEFYPKEKLTSAPVEAQEDVKVYTKKGGGGLNSIQPVPVEKLDEVKLCIRDRMDEYLNWITYPYGILPSVKDYNEDVGRLNDGVDIKSKYSRTVDEIKKEQFSTVLKDLPECKGILSEEDFSKRYEKDHEERIRLYNKMRGNLKL